MFPPHPKKPVEVFRSLHAACVGGNVDEPGIHSVFTTTSTSEQPALRSVRESPAPSFALSDTWASPHAPFSTWEPWPQTWRCWLSSAPLPTAANQPSASSQPPLMKRIIREILLLYGIFGLVSSSACTDVLSIDTLGFTFQVFSALSVFHWVTYQNISNANKSTFLHSHIYIWCFSCLKSSFLLSPPCGIFHEGNKMWACEAAWDTFLMVIMSFSGLGFAVWFMRFRLTESQLIKTPGFAEYTQVAHTNMISHVKRNQINIYLLNSK